MEKLEVEIRFFYLYYKNKIREIYYDCQQFRNSRASIVGCLF
jgi:hypothetical protein